MKLRPTAAALMLALAPMTGSLMAPAASAAPAAAQPAIANISVNSDAGLSPGATIRLQLATAPNAGQATVTLGDSGVVVTMSQKGAGNFTGSHVVRRNDRIDPAQLMTARVVVDGRTVSRQFHYPPSFQALAMGATTAPASVQAQAPAPAQVQVQPPLAPQPQVQAQAPVPPPVQVQTSPGPRMVIERFFIRSSGPVEAGRELRFRLLASPGGDAWLDIPGVIQGVDLRETRPGEYEGAYTVRQRDNPDAFRTAVASLRRGDDRVTAQLQFNLPPQITDLQPANGDRIVGRGRTHIGARITDEGGGVDPSRVRLRLNGRDVTGEARITPDEVHLRADLDPGRYAVELTARDTAGNMTTKTWMFEVVPERQAARVGGDLPLQLTSHRNETPVDADGNLLIQGRTVPHATVRVQVEQTSVVGRRAGVSRDVFDETIQADRNGLFSAAVPPRGRAGTLPGTRFEVRVTASSGNQAAEERITLIQRDG
ncbi:hypothetical protein WG902_12985 [Ramlibacter sp. PS3R-8]|uniref:hypothetical protein n=1 Tax=Ramlibacter sp. PS3R-8 TaxID=3133437 RepID=UPI00309EC648